MRLLFYDERCARAAYWPRALYHYFIIIWKHRRVCSPPMTPWECLKAAKVCTHRWVWGRIELDEYLVIRSRLK
jgi:hypothetical protein